MKKVFMIIGITLAVLLAVVGVILYLMYMYNPVLVNGVIDARFPLDITSENFPKTNNEFTLSFWYYIEGWKYKYNETKKIVDWDNGKLTVELNSTNNTMIVRMFDLQGKTHECVIEDIKLQKWNFVCLTLWNRSLDIILDDKYAQSCAQDNAPDYSNSYHMEILGKDGFNGKMSNIYFYNYARRFEDSIELYKLGPYYESWIYGLSNKIKGSIKINMSVSVNLEQDLIDMNDINYQGQGGINIDL